MITEIVFINLPVGTTRKAALDLYKQTANHWLSNPDLIEKYYFFDESQSLGGGVYIWKNREAVHRWHGEDYKQKVEKLYGSPPQIKILDVLMHIDPIAGRINESDSGLDKSYGFPQTPA